MIFVVRDAHLGTRFGWTSTTPGLPGFDPQDDYSSVVKKLGNPTGDHWFSLAPDSGGYRRLWYSRKGVTVILKGASPDSARYAGMLNRDGDIIDSADAALVHFLTELDSAPVIR